ncbi:acyl transferase/acyl hydrolase/lysophospholipase [Dendryphion nanum]|uniref:Lysophospholipase n=1 Tax=Dendryphion nanum TaxID=256645 RepID=A0A9P9E0V4_9PLEO|nr:acyl transferase/acyl hydrolase/lysophospholipase [Dendryphion nanum]
MAGLRKPQLRQHWLRGQYRMFFIRSRTLRRPTATTFALRYGPPTVLAAVTAGALVSPSSPYALVRTVHNDAPDKSSTWANLTPSILSGGNKQQSEHTTSISDAEKKFGDEGKSGQQAPPPQTRVVTKDEDGKAKADDDSGPWWGFTSKLASASDSFSSLGDTIADYVIPVWARVLPAYITKLQRELAMGPGSLAEEIWHEANDPEVNPEIIWDASVRVSEELCAEEKQFLQKRAGFTRRGLARYLDIPEAKIHPDDVPVIAMCGSGGGLRALVAGTSSYLSTHEDGLFDCVTYTAGVSGSCWLQTLYYSEITQRSHSRLIRHLKNRLGIHIAFPPDALELVASAPTNKYLLSGLVEKAKGSPEAEFGIVDIYGILLAARLLVPKGELSVHEHDFKVSNQRKFTDNGSQPLPIYTAVRHEIPLAEQDDASSQLEAEAKARKEAWFQWFEFTPYEFWCEELGAGIPTWSLGRKFENGRTVWRDNGLSLPEVRVPLLMGIWGSAFCATLSHYYKEIRPAVKGLTGFGGLDDMISGRNDELIKVHPIDPAAIPNFARGMRDYLPSTCPESLYDAQNLQLMDAGMSNNLPIYPLLRPGRNVDILIAFDASADVKTDNWLKVAEGYARQRGIKGWPVGTGWPSADESMEELQQDLDRAEAHSQAEADQKLRSAKREAKPKDLSYCNIWVGTTSEHTHDPSSPPSSTNPPPSTPKTDTETHTGIDKDVESDPNLHSPDDAGITVIYFPFLANPKVSGVDPKTSDFMSTWNFVYTPDQIDSVVELARTNFQEGSERTKRTVRAVYERKKRAREERERVGSSLRLGMGRRWRKEGKGEWGDQFE